MDQIYLAEKLFRVIRTRQTQFDSSLSYVVEDQSNPLYNESGESMSKSRASNKIQSSEVAPLYDDVVSPRNTKPHNDLMSTGVIPSLMQVPIGHIQNQQTEKRFGHSELASQSTNSEVSTNNRFLA